MDLQSAKIVLFNVFPILFLRLASHHAGGRRRNGASRLVDFHFSSSFVVKICTICSHTKLKDWFKPDWLNERAMGALNHNRRSADRLFVESNCIMVDVDPQMEKEWCEPTIRQV